MIFRVGQPWFFRLSILLTLRHLAVGEGNYLRFAG